jgi:Zn-dependent protease with chaperone function
MEASPPICGRWFDALTPVGRAVHYLPDSSELIFNDGESPARTLVRGSVRLSPSFGTPTRRVDLPDGCFCELDNDPRLEALAGPKGRGARLLAWLENTWGVVVLALFGLIALAVHLYLNVLPGLSQELAQRVPESWEQNIGHSVLVQLDAFELAPTELPDGQLHPIDARIRAFLATQGSVRSRLRVHFREAPRIGANAFALPSGDIVVTDALVRQIGEPDEIVAVIAHEAGHVQLRHGLQGMIKGSALALGSSLAFGDFSNIGLLATAVLDARYSRAQEAEADRYAIAALRAQKMDPCLLGRALAKLDVGARDSQDGAYLSSHPSTLKRIAQACPKGR